MFAHGSEAELALKQGRSAHALRWAEGADTEAIRPIHSALSCSTTRARILIEAGGARHRKTAAAILESLDRVTVRIHHHRRRLEVLALRSLVLAAEGDDERAFAALDESLRIAANGHFLRVYLDLGTDMRSLLARFPVPAGYEEYVAAIRSAFAREPDRAGGPAHQDLPDALTDRELEVLEQMAQRLSNKEIAARLSVSVATVKSHALAIYGKLHVHRRREAVDRATALGILPAS
jgi:LuxR family maltose regulon positive regulatory protein